MKKKTAILLIILIVVISGIIFVYYINKNTEPIFLPFGDEKIQKTFLPKSTGDIDDAVDALLQAASDEQSVAGNAEDDKKLIISDNQEISDFSQSVNEDEF